MRHLFYILLLTVYVTIAISATLEGTYIPAYVAIAGFGFTALLYIFVEGEKKKTTIKVGDLFVNKYNRSVYAIMNSSTISYTMSDPERKLTGNVYSGFWDAEDFLSERAFSYLGNINDVYEVNND